MICIVEHLDLNTWNFRVHANARIVSRSLVRWREKTGEARYSDLRRPEIWQSEIGYILTSITRRNGMKEMLCDELVPEQQVGMLD